MSQPLLAAADWGTSNMRVWLLGQGGEVLGERRSADGMATAAGRYVDVLEGHLSALGAAANLPVVVCGMAGAKQGWIDAGYVFAPARIEALSDGAVAAPAGVRRVMILPGLAQRGAETPDVMRGEETQIAGAGLGQGVHRVCLPGTHSKWADLQGGLVTGFRTAMTGELFALMSTQSILRHSVGEAKSDAANPAFARWLRLGMEKAGELTTHLFRIRAAGLVGTLAPPDAASALSGLLIGAEIAGAGVAKGHAVTLIASGALAELYAQAFAIAGIVMSQVDADAAVRAGLFVAGRRLFAGVQA